MNAPNRNYQLERPQDDWLDHLLREDARTHVDDSGFAERVLNNLPAKRQRSRIFASRWLPAMMTLFAVWLAVGVLPGGDVFLDGVADLMVADITSQRAVAMLGTMVVFIGWVVSFAAAER